MRLTERYSEFFPRSRELFDQARKRFPTGVTHDARMMEPFPPYISHAKGALKWSVEGRELVDYFIGHGSLLLGHSPDVIVTAVQEQMAKGTHYGACHELELEWAALIQNLIPSAERVRFTGSGTEATLMALRLTRMATGRPKILKFLGHFHGWHDAVTIGADPPYDSLTVPGITDSVAMQTVAIPPNDLNRVEDAFKNDAQIGGVILEPTGGHWGAVPIRGEFLRGLRELCTKYERLLIFDEVITGFRVAPGGAQEYYGVTPDLTSLAKIVAGGLPGGCLVGRADILAFIEPRPGKPKMRHPGTYNANPLSAAAGIAMLRQVQTGEANRLANQAGRDLRNRLNSIFASHDWPWCAYGDFSMVRIVPNYSGPRPGSALGDNDGFIPYANDLHKLDGMKDAKFLSALRQAMLLHGVDWWGTGGMTSAAHDSEILSRTVAAFEQAIPLLREFA